MPLRVEKLMLGGQLPVQCLRDVATCAEAVLPHSLGAVAHWPELVIVADENDRGLRGARQCYSSDANIVEGRFRERGQRAPSSACPEHCLVGT